MIKAKNLSLSFGDNWIFKNINFHILKSEFVFLLGHSGAGKTSLIQTLHGTLPIDRGKLEIAGLKLDLLPRKKVYKLKRQVSVVFQDFCILKNRTIFDNVALPLIVKGLKPHIIKKYVNSIVRSVNLENKINSPCAWLSGGEQQRVAIARAIVTNPKVLLADEPTGNLDWELSLHLLKVFYKFNEHGTTVIMATHNLQLLELIPKARIIYIENGNLFEINLKEAQRLL